MNLKDSRTICFSSDDIGIKLTNKQQQILAGQSGLFRGLFSYCQEAAQETIRLDLSGEQNTQIEDIELARFLIIQAIQMKPLELKTFEEAVKIHQVASYFQKYFKS